MNNHALPLIDKMTIVENEGTLTTILSNLYEASKNRPVRISFINAHGFNMVWKNPAFAADIMDCDCVFRDGAGMKILYRLLGCSAGLNLNGTDLIPRILSDFSGQSVALMGTAAPFLDNAAAKVAAIGLTVTAKVDGFQDGDAYVVTAAQMKPALIVLAMGMPKQERIARKLAGSPAIPSGLILCGGAVLDFMGGKVSRAPALFRKTGMEWLYRLALEPKRLFGRYVLGNGMFLVRAVLTKAALKQP